MEGKKENSNILFLLLAIVFIIITFIILIGAYGIYLNRPYNYYKTTINNKYLKFNEEKAKVFKFNPAENKLESNVKVNFEIKTNGQKINQEFLDFSAASDFANKYVDTNLKIGATNTKTNFILKDNQEIINDKSIYEKPLIFDNEFNIDWKYLQNINEKDFDTITSSIKNEVIKTLNKKSFETESTKINVNGKDIKAKKITYVDKDLKGTSNKIIKNLTKNNDFIKAVSNMANVSEKDVTNYLNDLKVTKDLKPLTVNLYTTGLFSKLAKIEFIYEDYTISYLNYKDTNYAFILDYKGEDNLTITADENKDKELDLKVKYNKDTILKGVITEHDDDNFKMKFDAEVMNEKVSGKINVTTKKNTKDTLVKKTEIIIYTDSKKEDYYKLNIETSINKVKKVKQANTDKAVKFDDLKKADQNKVEKKMEKLIDNMDPFEVLEKSTSKN